MDLFLRVDINLYSILILTVLWISASRQARGRNFQYRLFYLLLALTVSLLFFDTMTWLMNGRSGLMSLRINQVLTAAIFILAPLPGILWVMYADYQIFLDRERVQKTARFMILPIIVNTGLAMASPATGWLFSIDQLNTYSRGSLFGLYIVVTFLPICYALLLTILNSRRLGSKELGTMVVFPIPPLACGLLQLAFYGVPAAWTGLTLAILIVYINIQNGLMHTDYLTGVYNRRQADDYLRQKIRATEQGRGFSGILIDIDDFKLTNDYFGHAEGDVCLGNVVQILRSTLRRDDFVARMGGDEFLVILDISTRDELNRAVERINHAINDYNAHSGKPYRISLSMGFDLYEAGRTNGRTQYIKHLDSLMYNNKLDKRMRREQAAHQGRRGDSAAV